MAELLYVISIISFAAAGVCFLLAVFFWFKFGILRVIGDLSGRTARKSIAQIRESNERSGIKSYRPSAVNVNRGKLTDAMKTSGKLMQAPQTNPAPPSDSRPETGLLKENKAVKNSIDETALLRENQKGKGIPLKATRTEGVKLKMIVDEVIIHTDEVIT